MILNEEGSGYVRVRVFVSIGHKVNKTIFTLNLFNIGSQISNHRKVCNSMHRLKGITQIWL